MTLITRWRARPAQSLWKVRRTFETTFLANCGNGELRDSTVLANFVFTVFSLIRTILIFFHLSIYFHYFSCFFHKVRSYRTRISFSHILRIWTWWLCYWTALLQTCSFVSVVFGFGFPDLMAKVFSSLRSRISNPRKLTVETACVLQWNNA